MIGVLRTLYPGEPERGERGKRTKGCGSAKEDNPKPLCFGKEGG